MNVRPARNGPTAPRPKSELVEAPATRAGMQRLVEAFTTFAERHDASADVRHDVYVALDEIISNAVKYGGHGRRGRMSLELSIHRGALQAVFSDNGVAFNPLDAVRPDTTQALEDRPIGGLGILLVKELMDGARYERRDGWNRLTLTRKLARGAKA